MCVCVASAGEKLSPASVLCCGQGEENETWFQAVVLSLSRGAFCPFRIFDNAWSHLVVTATVQNWEPPPPKKINIEEPSYKLQPTRVLLVNSFPYLSFSGGCGKNQGESK